MIIKNLKIDNSKIFKSSFNRHNLFNEVRAKNENTDIDLLKFIIKSKSIWNNLLFIKKKC